MMLSDTTITKTVKHRNDMNKNDVAQTLTFVGLFVCVCVRKASTSAIASREALLLLAINVVLRRASAMTPLLTLLCIVTHRHP
jgi:hypothetical protein